MHARVLAPNSFCFGPWLQDSTCLTVLSAPDSFGAKLWVPLPKPLLCQPLKSRLSRALPTGTLGDGCVTLIQKMRELSPREVRRLGPGRRDGKGHPRAALMWSTG